MDALNQRAHHAVQAWLRAAQRCTLGLPPAFPFPEVTAAIRRHGSAALPSAVNRVLIEAADRAEELAGRPPARSWFAARWLWSATAGARGSPSYDAYVMCGLLDQYCQGAGDFRANARALGTALTADLLGHELAPQRARHARSRTRAAIHLAADLRRAMRGAPLQPAGGADDGTDPEKEPGLEPADALRLCERAVSVVQRSQSPQLRTVLAYTPLVVTAEHDEYLFIRSIQIMELLSSLAASHAQEALGCAERTAVPEFLVHLEGLRRTLDHSARLFHIVATVDPLQFAGIRDATHGTGALQSPAFAALERLCRGAEALRPETAAAVPADRRPCPDTPLGPALEQLLGRVDPDTAARLEEAAAAVDRQWLRWKRAHHGVARRIIGDVPGTGGTLGITYLAEYMHTPLLTRHAEPVGPARRATPGGPS
ncbi:tryptophan 2,3-dioxygenase [Peterkaempfera griseoplana]|uniref:hypothetical protein n=1 Tax=Peterkaempfera griseoplana TaxID=66896 RepID=UPI0006E26564|nr:hypothetical protein [Peterkaempfera griseoplana]